MYERNFESIKGTRRSNKGIKKYLERMKFKESERESDSSVIVGVILVRGQEIRRFLPEIAWGWKKSLSHYCSFEEESEKE
jgi:hypothetical protein